MKPIVKHAGKDQLSYEISIVVVSISNQTY